LRFQPIVLMVVLLTLVSLMVWGQSASDPQTVPGKRPPIPGRETSPEDENLAQQMQEMAKKANRERQAQLKRDTDKLFQLSTELKQYVDKTNENVLSLEVLKKAEEIEKLAHNVKTRMKGNN
jgi:hypothetical protein